MDKTLLYYTNKGELLKFKKYTINEKGEIKNKKTDNYLKTHKNNGSYCYTKLRLNNKQKILLLHRAILSTFKSDEYFKDAQANHIDENKDNNCLANLEWLSPKDNTNHGTGNERRRKNNNKKPVLCYDLNDNFIKEYDSTMATKKDDFDPTCVIRCCKGKQKTHKNHKFYYKKI